MRNFKKIGIIKLSLQNDKIKNLLNTLCMKTILFLTLFTECMTKLVCYKITMKKKMNFAEMRNENRKCLVS